MLLPRRDSDTVLTDARATTRRVARTFSIACRLLPRDVRDDVYRLYLAFRTLDDLVDEAIPGAAERVDALERWCRVADVGSPEAEILDDLAGRHPMPRDALLDFCAGMREDIEARPIDSEADLDRYCYRVAGTVGLVMAALLGVRGDEAEAGRAAAALGMAMQRTNILRDIDEDRANGRTYLSAETLARFGPPAPGRREALLRDQIARADALYDEGIAGICRLRRGRRGIAAAAAMYREILRQIERDGYGAREGRAVVGAPRKLLVAARSGALVV
jgi:15-cis-phytoene synthase